MRWLRSWSSTTPKDCHEASLPLEALIWARAALSSVYVSPSRTSCGARARTTAHAQQVHAEQRSASSVGLGDATARVAEDLGVAGPGGKHPAGGRCAASMHVTTATPAWATPSKPLERDSANPAVGRRGGRRAAVYGNLVVDVPVPPGRRDRPAGHLRFRRMELGITGRRAAVAATSGLGLGTAKALAAEGVGRSRHL